MGKLLSRPKRMTGLRWVWAVVALGWAPFARAEIGIAENLGGKLPLEVEVIAEDGQAVKLGELVRQRPTLLALVYYGCPNICGILLQGVASLLERIDLVPGKDFQVLTLSFNPEEKPELASKKKENFLKSMGQKIDPAGWRFLTAGPEAIRAVTGAVGFRYEQKGADFDHPAALIALSPNAKVVRYLYGVTFLPFDVKMALYEAAAERPGPTINRVLLYCYSYDPQGKTYTFNFLRVTGTLTLLMVALFAAVLIVTSRRRRPGKAGRASQEDRKSQENAPSGVKEERFHE